MIPSSIIKLDKNTKTFFMPTLLLMTRDFKTLGKISKYQLSRATPACSSA